MQTVSIHQEGITVKAYYQTHQSDTLLVFLHGWGGSAKSFDPLLKLIPKQYDTLQLSLPGFGNSDMPPNTGWTTPQYAKWFKAWIDQFFKQYPNSYKNIVLYGHSFGCRVIVRFLLQNPDWKYPIILTGAAGIKHKLPSRAKLAQLITKIIKPVKSLLPPKLKKIILKKIFKAHDWAEAPEALKKTLTKVLNETDIRDQLSHIQNPILLLWGAKDSYTIIDSAHIFEQKLPNAQLVIFPEGKHGIHYTHKEEIVTAVKKFLK